MGRKRRPEHAPGDGPPDEQDPSDFESDAALADKNPNPVTLTPGSQGGFLRLTKPRQEAFLERLAGKGERGPVCAGLKARTCASLNISTSAVDYLRKHDGEFSERYDMALTLGNEYLFEVAHDRAINGWVEPVFGKDGQVGVIRKRSESLLTLILKARMPETFRENIKMEHANDPKNPVGAVLLPVLDPNNWREQIAAQQKALQERVKAKR